MKKSIKNKYRKKSNNKTKKYKGGGGLKYDTVSIMRGTSKLNLVEGKTPQEKCANYDKEDGRWRIPSSFDACTNHLKAASRKQSASETASKVANKGYSSANSAVSKVSDSASYVAKRSFEKIQKMYVDLNDSFFNSIESYIKDSEKIRKMVSPDEINKTLTKIKEYLENADSKKYIENNIEQINEKLQMGNFRSIFKNNEIIKKMKEASYADDQKEFLLNYAGNNEHMKKIINGMAEVEPSPTEQDTSPATMSGFTGGWKNKYSKQKGGGVLEISTFIALTLIGFSTSPFLMVLFILSGAYPLLGMFMLNPEFSLLNGGKKSKKKLSQTKRNKKNKSQKKRNN